MGLDIELGTTGPYYNDTEKAEALLKVLEHFHSYGNNVPMYAAIYIAHVGCSFAHRFLAFQGVHYSRKKGVGWYIISHWHAEDPYHKRLAKIFKPGVC